MQSRMKFDFGMAVGFTVMLLLQKGWATQLLLLALFLSTDGFITRKRYRGVNISGAVKKADRVLNK